MSLVVRTCLIAFPQVVLLSTAAFALPAEVGRVADVFTNAIAYQDAKVVPEAALQLIEIPQVVAIAPIAPLATEETVVAFTEVVADTVDRGAPVLAAAIAEDIAPAIVTQAASAPVIENPAVIVTSQRPRARGSILPLPQIEEQFIAAAFAFQPGVYFVPTPSTAVVDTTDAVDPEGETLVAFEAPIEEIEDAAGDLLTEMADANPNLTIREGEDGEEDTMMMLSDVLFQFGKADLAPEAEQTLAAIAGSLEEVNELIVTGHTDAIGSEENNLALGQARAEAVRDWLLQNSELTSDIVLAKGVGEADPIAPNVTDNGQDNPEGRAQNRRVEFAIK